MFAYPNGEGGYGYLKNKYDTPAQSLGERWVLNYQSFGDKGLMRSRQQEMYSFEMKLSVVELY
ncbi:MAG: transposase, partial [Firmicutes bacterium]|nr:transposase [Candidatus Fiminaster equi]